MVGWPLYHNQADLSGSMDTCGPLYSGTVAQFETELVVHFHRNMQAADKHYTVTNSTQIKGVSGMALATHLSLTRLMLRTP